jgi:hypothetical protein
MDAMNAMNAPVGELVGRATPCRRHHGHCLRWAAPGQLLGARQSALGRAACSPRLISRLLARLTTVSAEIAFKHATLFVLAAETHSR